MRRALSLVLLLAACSPVGQPSVPSAPDATPAAQSARPLAPATAPAAQSARPSARPLAPATLDCTVTWAESFRSLQAMFDRADVVARGRVSAQGPTLVYGYGGNGRFARDARLTTLRVSETFKGAPVGELKIVEDVCPGLAAGTGDEWIIFASAADPRYGPDAPGTHYFTIGGPQGQFRLTNGRVSGPYFAFQRVARSEADEAASDLAARLRAMTGADAEARSIFERHSWMVVRTRSVSELVLPAAADLGAAFQYVCGEAPVAHCADLSGRIGLDLRSGAGQDARVLSFVLELPTPIGGGAYPPTGVAVAVGQRVIGAWVVSAVTRDVYAVSDRANVPVDR